MTVQKTTVDTLDNLFDYAYAGYWPSEIKLDKPFDNDDIDEIPSEEILNKLLEKYNGS